MAAKTTANGSSDAPACAWAATCAASSPRWGSPPTEKMGSFWPRTSVARPSIAETPVTIGSLGASRGGVDRTPTGRTSAPTAGGRRGRRCRPVAHAPQPALSDRHHSGAPAKVTGVVESAGRPYPRRPGRPRRRRGSRGRRRASGRNRTDLRSLVPAHALDTLDEHERAADGGEDEYATGIRLMPAPPRTASTPSRTLVPRPRHPPASSRA